MRISRVALLFALVIGLASIARADPSVNSSPAPWGQIGPTQTLSASGTSGTVALGWTLANPVPPDPPLAIVVCNTASGAVDAYVLPVIPSTGTVTTSTGTLVTAGACRYISQGLPTNRYLAAITGGSATTLTVMTGSGTFAAGGLGSGGGLGVFMTTSGSNATAGAMQALATKAGTNPLALNGSLGVGVAPSLLYSLELNSATSQTGALKAQTNSSRTSGDTENVQLFGANDRISPGVNYWGLYNQVTVSSGAASGGHQTFGEEMTMINNNPAVGGGPFNVNQGTGTVNHRLDCAGATSCDHALDIIFGAQPYVSGIVFGTGALDITGDVNPAAISFPAGVNGYSLRWWNAANDIAWNIYSTSTSGHNSLALNNTTAVFTVPSLITQAATGTAEFAINSVSASQVAALTLKSAGTAKWQLGNDATNAFFLDDVINGLRMVTVAGGNTTLGGNTTFNGSIGINTTASPSILLDVSGGVGDGTTVNIARLDSITASASGRPAFAFHNSAGGLDTAQISSSPGSSYNASKLYFSVADSSRVLQDRMVIDSGGGIAISTMASDATHTDATVCRDTTSGLLLAGSGTLGICLGTSSLRFKHDVRPLTAGLGDIMRLEPIVYRYNEGHGDSRRDLYGFAAEQVEKVLPDLVSMDSEGRANSADYIGVIPVLVRAVQQQQAEIASLKDQVSHLQPKP